MSDSITTTAPFTESYPDALAVFCSDGRFTDAVDQLLEKLGHPRLDTLTIPGGPGLLNHRTSGYSDCDTFTRSAEFLIREHTITTVVLLAHEGCGFYGRKFPDLPAAEIKQRQCADLRLAMNELHDTHPRLRIEAFVAVPDGNHVRFEARRPMKLDIVQVGTPVLRQQARALALEELASPRIQELIENMRETMRAAPGVGLAAPQIGESLRLVVIEDAPQYIAKLTPEELAQREREAVPFHVLVNPTLTVRSDEVVAAFEGCLSFNGFSMVVPRARKVRVEALDEHGQKVVKVATGWYARILQHEVDHLNGIVCCDRMEPRTLTTMTNYTKHWSTHSVDDVRAAVALPAE